MIFPSSKAILFGLAIVAALSGVSAFIQPKNVAHSSIEIRRTKMNTGIPVESRLESLKMLPDELSTATSIILSAEVDDIAGANAALGGLRTFFAVITAVVFGFAGLTYVTAAFIVPKAAEQLENDTKRLRPGLWEEFEAKLGEGETMASRPDLLQELGNIMQPIIIADFEESANAKDEGKGSGTSLGDSDQWKD